METVFLMMGSGKGGGFEPLFMLAFVAILYFFMLRPQAKKQKEAKQFGSTIAVGDRVVTIGGIHGKISKINADGTMVLDGERNSSMIIEASAVSMEMTKAMQKRIAGSETKA